MGEPQTPEAWGTATRGTGDGPTDKQRGFLMALYVRTEQRELSEAIGSVGELKNVILHSVFEAHRFTDSQNTQAEVAGNRDGSRVSVIYLFIGGRNFWRVVAVGSSGDFNAARTIGDEVAVAIDNLRFL